MLSIIIVFILFPQHLLFVVWNVSYTNINLCNLAHHQMHSFVRQVIQITTSCHFSVRVVKQTGTHSRHVFSFWFRDESLELACDFFNIPTVFIWNILLACWKPCGMPIKLLHPSIWPSVFLHVIYEWLNRLPQNFILGDFNRKLSKHFNILLDWIVLITTLYIDISLFLSSVEQVVKSV